MTGDAANREAAAVTSLHPAFEVVTPFLYAGTGDTLAADFGTLGEIQLDITV